MGAGWFGWAVNVTCVLWTLFVCVVFSMPNVLPVTGENMNYAAVSNAYFFRRRSADDPRIANHGWCSRFVAVSAHNSFIIDAKLMCSLGFGTSWGECNLFLLLLPIHSYSSGRRHYHGPTSDLPDVTSSPAPLDMKEIDTKEA